jgi:sirohydrochlorin cobaltochelatase
MAVILLAHGSGDPRWRKTFEDLIDRLKERLKPLPCELAYMEFASPTLEDTARKVAAAGAKQITIVPAFFSSGGHVAHDLPELLDSVRKSHPQVTIEMTGALGEFSEVQEAMIATIAGIADR